MAKKGFRISKEIKEQIISRIKVDGISVNEAATASVSALAHNKLKKENQQLKEIIGELTIKMSLEAKKGSSRG